MADLKAFKDKLFAAAKAAGLAEYELYTQSGASFSVSVFNGEVAQYTDAVSVGASFRGKYNGKMGYAYSEKIDDSVIDFLVNSAKENATIIEEDEVEEIYPGDSSYPEIVTYNPALAAVNTEDKIAAALAVEKSAKESDERVKSVPYCGFTSAEFDFSIANSKGLDVSRKTNFCYSFAHCQVADETGVKMGGESFVGRDFGKLNPTDLGKISAEKALAKLGAKSIESGKYPIIFEPSQAASLLGVFVGGFSGEAAQKGFSLLKGKLGEAVASAVVTIIDDPLLPNALASTPFDSEGVASRTKTVIDKGIFKTFLHNTKSAKKDGVAPTGNGFKMDFKSPVAITATNFFIQPGEISADDLAAKMGRGLMITSMQGLHSGANPISGDFSLSADGFLIEDGKIVRPVEQITISGNFFQVLKDIEEVANDLIFKSPSATNNVASPSILVKSLDVAGI
ncbi:MAG: TldD/PmbA family protein [Defluviitaleaceae bacterium]|nr:TldD/PmbA family protein [Defluviitaleaceae bacterium]